MEDPPQTQGVAHDSHPIEPKGGAGPSPLVIGVAGLTALAVAMGIGRFAFTPILPMMQQELAMSVGAGGWLASANYLGYLLGALFAATLRVRTATAVRAGLVVIGLATLGMGLTESFPAWLALRALAGVASAWVLIFSSAWALATLGAAGRSVLRGVVFAGVGIGIAGAGVFCVVLMRWGVGPVMAWLGLGVAALVACLLVCTSILSLGHLAMWSIILVGLFNSVMFPSIFTLGIAELGPLTGDGSGLLIMAIVGGALIPLAQGRLADMIGLHHAFVLPAICYLYIIFYAFRGSKPVPVRQSA